MNFKKPTMQQRERAKARRVESRARFLERITAEAHLASLLFVGAADGPLTEVELRHITAGFPTSDTSTHVTKDIVAQKLRAYMLSCGPSLAERRRLRSDLLRLAVCDGSLSSEETEALREIDDFLRLLPDKKNPGRSRWGTQRKSTSGSDAKKKAKTRTTVAAEASHPGHWSYEYLGCSESDSDEKIKRCYRELAVKLHPDKHAARVKTPEEAVPHMRAFQKLQEAYAEIWKLRGRVSRKDS